MSAMMLCSMLTVPAYADGENNVNKYNFNDKEEITNTGIDLSNPKLLNIAKPAKDITTTAEKYTITGTSDPNYSLTINGEKIENRGEQGSWGVRVSLEMGVNTFTVKNGKFVQTVKITRQKAETNVAKTTRITNVTPTYDDFAFEGEYVLKCTAPSGAKVTAKIDGKTVELKQVAATAENGVPAIYKAVVNLKANKNSNKVIPYVTYKMTFNGQVSEIASFGNITVLPANSNPTVEITQHATSVYEKNDTTSNFVSTLNAGARDKIVECDGDLVKLSMGGWVKKEFLKIVEGNPKILNVVKSTSFEIGKGGEYLTLKGDVPSTFRAYMDGEKVWIKFNNMKGIKNIPLKNSKLFSKTVVTSDSKSTTIEFYLKEKNSLLGYDITYNDDGSIRIFFNAKPKLGSKALPLKNVTVVVDPGHGGMDPGALGVLNGTGTVEDEINMAHAIALQKRLESLGAKVVVTVPQDLSEDKKIVLHDRVDITRNAEADFFVSLHCNSTAGENELKASGSEVYYYEDVSQNFSQSVISNLSAESERNLRGTYYSNYFVTRNSICPALLLEMGFISNPKEYDDLCSKDSLWQCANAVSTAILDALQ